MLEAENESLKKLIGEPHDCERLFKKSNAGRRQEKMKAVELMLTNDVSLRKALSYFRSLRLNLLLQVFPANRNTGSHCGREGQGGSLQASNLWNKENRCHAQTWS